MLSIDHDRRGFQRVGLSRPCKVFDPRSRKYSTGALCNVSVGGMLLRLDRPVNLEPGDRVYVAVAQKRRQVLLRSSEMIEAEVVRVLPITSGGTALAVRMADPGEELQLPVRLAA